MAKQVIGVGSTANDGTGDALRSAMVKVNANFDELYTGQGKAAFRADKNGTAQTGLANNAYTKITFTNEVFDIGAFYDAPNSRWTPPAGVCRLSGAVQFPAATGANPNIIISLYKNGAALVRNNFEKTAAGVVTVALTETDMCNGTDYYEIFAYHIETGGATATINGTTFVTRFSGEMV